MIPLQSWFLRCGRDLELLRATACVKGFVHAFHTVNDAAGWEIRCFHVLHELVNGDVVVVDVRDAPSTTSLRLWEHVGGHPDGNARSAIHQ